MVRPETRTFSKRERPVTLILTRRNTDLWLGRLASDAVRHSLSNRKTRFLIPYGGC
jgi:hypothetical protein